VALCKEKTPIILDGIGCVSDNQFNAVKTYLSKGGQHGLPFLSGLMMIKE